MEVALSSETSVNIYQSVRRHTAEKNYFHSQGIEELKSHEFNAVSF
jgi:hypothetical protein